MPKNPLDRRINISVPSSLMLEAGANHCNSLEDYITFLKKELDKKDMQYQALKNSVENK